jgi:thiamine kinase-like enzyme
MNFFNIKSRASGNLIVKIGNKIIKFPVTISAYKENEIENKILTEVKKDRHFFEYLPNNKLYFLIFQVVPFLETFTLRRSELIDGYFQKAFAGSSNWAETKLINIIGDDFLSFVRSNLNSEYTFWEKVLENLIIGQSSCHGDFHPENILIEEGKLFFIDWIKYNSKSSRYFDLIDFFIFSRKNNSESWTEFLLNNLDISVISKIQIKRENLVAYAIWKVSEELKTFKSRNRLNSQKIKKYLFFLEKLQIKINKTEIII